jgi:D-alanine-D-alanine ligase
MSKVIIRKSEVIHHSPNEAYDEKKHIAVVYGGMSAEREVSLMSSVGIIETLVRLGYKVTGVDMGNDFATVIQEVNPDIVFNCLHGTYGEDGCVPGVLNILRIPYTHSGLLSSAVSFNKIFSRNIFMQNDIPCANGLILHKNDVNGDPMSRPYVIKPIAEGSSLGVEIVFEDDKFNMEDYKFEYGDKVIVEEYIPGHELQVAVLNGKALNGILEIELLKRRFYDYDTKYVEGFANHILPAVIPHEVADRILHLSEKACEALGCRGMVRVEWRYDSVSNRLFILEVNTHPGFTPLSICPEIAKYCGVPFDMLLENLLSSAAYDGMHEAMCE